MAKTRSRIHQLCKQWKNNANRKTPTEELISKAMSRLQRFQLDGSKFNLTTYRQVIINQPLIQVQLELMHVFALWMQVLAVTMGSGTSNQPISKEDSVESMQNAYADVTNWEHKLFVLYEESRSLQSKMEAFVAGVRLRSFYLLALNSHSQRSASTEDSVAILKEELTYKFESLKTSKDCRSDDIKAVQPLVEQCLRPAVFYQRMTSEEKRSIQLVMKFTDTHTGEYQCPNGHPYVIADCGGAMERSTCLECHATIGGERHRVVDSNTGAHWYFQ